MAGRPEPFDAPTAGYGTLITRIEPIDADLLDLTAFRERASVWSAASPDTAGKLAYASAAFG